MSDVYAWVIRRMHGRDAGICGRAASWFVGKYSCARQEAVVIDRRRAYAGIDKSRRGSRSG